MPVETKLKKISRKKKKKKNLFSTSLQSLQVI